MDRTVRLAEDIAGRLGGCRGWPPWSSAARGPVARHARTRTWTSASTTVRRPSDVENLRRLAQNLDDRRLPDLATDLGAWGPWINGGGWLRVEGQSVDWLYRDAGKVWAIVERCARGETACHYQPGHPHGFHEHIYPGEVHHCRVLHDPDGLLRGLKAAVAVCPPKLKREVVGRHLWEAGFSLETARKPAARGEASYVSGCLFRGVSCMVQALFAANGRWFLKEKGSVAAVASFPLRPQGFPEGASRLLGCPGRDARALAETVSRYETLLDEVRRSCGKESG